MLFRRKSKAPSAPLFDPETEEAVIRSSICTGELTAGFRNRETGRFREYLLIRDEDDRRAFLSACGLEDCRIIY